MKLLGLHKPLLGVVHLAPLPTAPGFRGSMDRILARALADARSYLSGGFDGLVVENYGDLPFHAGSAPPATVAALTTVAGRLRDLGDFPLGINVLRSDGVAAMAIAAAVGAQFVRVNVLTGAMVTDQGLIQGCAAEVMRLRQSLRAKVAVWGDLAVKHAAPLTPQAPIAAALDLRERALADAVILTGPRTGMAADEDLPVGLRRALPRCPILVGSGVSAKNLNRWWHLADGFIVGTSLKRGGRTAAAVDPVRVGRIVAVRESLARAEPGRRAGGRHPDGAGSRRQR